MTNTKIKILRVALATIVGVGCLFVSDNVSLIKSGSLITEAYAVIGRPLTPMSYAGVARRTTYGAAVVAHPAYPAAVYAAPVYGAHVYVAPVCAQVVNAYGQISTVCR